MVTPKANSRIYHIIQEAMSAAEKYWGFANVYGRQSKLLKCSRHVSTNIWADGFLQMVSCDANIEEQWKKMNSIRSQFFSQT